MKRHIANKRSTSWFGAFAITATLGLFASPTWASTCTVTSSADTGPNTLRTCMSTSGVDTIYFGTLSPNPNTITLVSTLPTVSTTLLIDGSTAPLPVTVSGNGATQIMSNTGDLTLNELTITDGNNTSGGGIYNNGTLMITNSILSGNTSTSTSFSGGGIYNDTSGSLTIINSTLTGNTCTAVLCQGGGIYSNGNLMIFSSTLESNSADLGGGIANNVSGILMIANSTLSGNTAAQPAPPVSNSNSNGNGLMLQNTNLANSINRDSFGTFILGSHGNGGGIFNEGTLTLINSTLADNVAANGGGISNFLGTAVITNSTLSGNSAGHGGGIYLDSGILTIQNTIVANSPNGSDCDLFSTFNAGLDSMADDSTCTGATHVSSAALNLGPLANNGGPTKTFALLPGSVAINGGNNVYAIDAGLMYDQRGPFFTRYSDGIVDVGAYEFQFCPGQ